MAVMSPYRLVTPVSFTAVLELDAENAPRNHCVLIVKTENIKVFDSDHTLCL